MNTPRLYPAIKGEKGDTGGTGSTGATGATGAAGSNGSNGSNGADGATWYTGSGAPDDGTGVDNDLYLDTSNGDVYKKVAGSWGAPIENLTGPGGSLTYEIHTSISAKNLENVYAFQKERAIPLGGGSAADVLSTTPASGTYLVKFMGMLQGGIAGGRAEMGLFKGTTNLLDGSRMMANFSDHTADLDATAMFIAEYGGTNADADQAGGSATGTLINDEGSLGGGCLSALDDEDAITFHHGGATYNAASNADFVQTGAVRISYIPHFYGIPAASFLTLFDILHGPFAGENRIHAFIWSSGQIAFIINDKDGNNILFEAGFTPTWIAGQRYEFEFNFDFNSGDIYVFQDGALMKHWTGVTCTRDTTIGFLGVMTNHSDNSPADGQMDSIYIWNTVQHTAAFESEAAGRMGRDLGDVTPVHAMGTVILDGSTEVSVQRKCFGQSSLLWGTLELIKVG